MCARARVCVRAWEACMFVCARHTPPPPHSLPPCRRTQADEARRGALPTHTQSRSVLMRASHGGAAAARHSGVCACVCSRASLGACRDTERDGTTHLWRERTCGVAATARRRQVLRSDGARCLHQYTHRCHTQLGTHVTGLFVRDGARVLVASLGLPLGEVLNEVVWYG